MIKSFEKLCSYISLWCGARNKNPPYQFTLVFDYDREHMQTFYFFENENDMLHAKDYLQDNRCLVRVYSNRNNAYLSECKIV